MILDPTTDIGRMRLRCGDYSDFPVMPDAVYTSALSDSSGNVPQASRLVAQYILGALTGQVHQKLAQIEVFGAEWFQNYLSFLKTTILNPNLADMYPMPYTPLALDQWGNVIEVPLIQFQKDWNNCYVYGTQTQFMHLQATLGPGYPGYDPLTQQYF